MSLMSHLNPVELVDALLPRDENNPASVRNYRLRTAFVACATCAVVFLFVVPTLVPFIPFMAKVAWADDVDDKINSAMKPVLQQLKEQNDALREIRKDQLATKLRELHTILCATPDRVTVARMADLTGDRYPFDRCGL